ncbi:DNA replication initiation factor CDC45 TDEL_0F04190 [Torulaspora delbrueckii]|uniref:CDC45-like protein n=1 Tax=Torulaspora delbrueckii TaxID=4950 RepID=G8ZX86_TORDE|nr:hypothetical protein TDEL_0F04190 [Torulaspora delbrueckii]CCE93230.1 hypothetical protein TDEL_0F04190 [Torulaspora delbrueckii]
MYYEIRQIAEPYNDILRDSSSHSSCQLVIFVSCLNIDALCATKMLSQLLKRQLVQLQIVPVFGYAELKSHYSRLDDNINSVILVGCGGSIDIESFFEIDPKELLVDNEDKDVEKGAKYRRNIYVFDAHRPWNLDNLFGSDIVNCMDDGTVEEELSEQKKAYFRLLELDNEMKEGDDEEETDAEQTDKDENDDDDDDEVEFVNRKRPSPESKKQSRKQQKKEIHELETTIEEYYSSGTSVVNSLSLQVYSLISAVGECNLNYLWLTILGATSLDTPHPQVYNRLYPLLQDEVKRISLSNYSGKTPDSLSLEIQPDYYLFLLRHSSLYDSFFYSNFVNAKLSLWRENGKKRLHKMFATMGIPITTAQETWIYMDHSIKRELGIIFEKNLERYGLQDIIRDGFVRTLGFRGSVSASEFVEALTALLEAGQSKNGLAAEFNNTQEKASDQSTDSDLPHKRWIANFWQGWDALDNDKITLLKHGIKLAQSLQKAIFNTGVTILEKKLIKDLRIYRLCVLQDGPDLDLYQNPLTLLRLGNWLIEFCAESEEKHLLPMVLATLNDSTDTYLVAGLPPRYPRGLDNSPVRKPIVNNFSMAFQYMTSETGARVKIDNFESSIIEIRRDDLLPFLEKLTMSGLL